MRRYKVFFKNGLIILITSILMRSIGMFFNIYISNKIGSEAVGLFTLITSVYMFSVTVASSGIQFACNKLISSEHNIYNYKNILRDSLKLSGFFGISAFFILFLLSDYICITVLNNKLPSYLIKLMAISLPFISMSASFTGYFTGLRQVAKNSFARIFEQFIKMAIIFLLLTYILPSGIEFACLSLILGEIISEISSFLYNVFTYYKDSKKILCRGINSYIGKLIKIVSPLSITSYLKSGLSSFKQFLIPQQLALSNLSYDSAISIFGKIQGMAMPLLLFPEVITSSFSSLLITEFSYYNSFNKKKEMKFIISKIFKVSFIFVIAISGIFFFYGNDIGVLVYNDASIGKYIQLLSPLVIVMYLDSIIDNILKGLDKQTSVMLCNIADSIITIISIFILVPKFGILGYFISLYISEIFNFTVSITLLYKTINFKLNMYSLFIIPIISCLLAYYISFYVHNKNMWFGFIFFVVMYILFLFGFSYTKNESIKI